MSDKDKENQRLTGLLGAPAAQTQSAEERAKALAASLDEQKKITNDALAKVEMLNQQLAALRLQLASIQEALDASEAKDKESQAKIADLGQRLNVALAKKVQELAALPLRLLRQAEGSARRPRRLPDRRRPLRVPLRRAVRFRLGRCCKPEATPQLDKLAAALRELETQIPPDIAWVMRVDGHTDIKPIATPEFPSNWELSSARAISVVRYLMEQGVPANRLVAAGFGEFQPIDAGDSDEALAQEPPHRAEAHRALAPEATSTPRRRARIAARQAAYRRRPCPIRL